ncbi:cytochrome P450 [Suhomyces tanzawaensis NRRL Y-17324]|uniref:Cytochrome P450 n=1 Tax=Suhomyces tanzawaensis NRRL Y-17324 TaxID=984487 RepID=A0A1E4SLR0_9ASCO|nr:cytochrome P450 [Suhomyces tanzawaensis NRRL Y-17324]ODV80418.1 cytochrome P450 [Suhomyces tanzawaensis NRRL Y-17324]
MFEQITGWQIAVVGAVIFYFGAIFAREQAFKRKYGCKSPKVAPGSSPWDGSIRLLLRLLRMKKEGTMMDYICDFFLTDLGGRSMYIRLAGKKIICTTEPENVKAILATQFNDFALGNRHEHFKPLLGNGIFTLDDEGWKHSRAMLRPQFSREQVAHVQALEPHLQVLAEIIRRSKGKTIDIQELFFELTVDTASEFLFGESVDSLKDRLAEMKGVPRTTSSIDGKADFAEAFNTAQGYLATRSFSQSFYLFVTNREFRQSCSKVHRFAKHYVDKALQLSPQQLDEVSKSGYVFLYELVKQTRNPTVLQDQLLNILVAGRDTTAGLLSFVFYELARNPEVFEKLKQEVYSTFGEGDDANIDGITFESLKKCEYLKQVINECLRLYPSVPNNFRVATKDTTLPLGGGEDEKSPIFISKGQTVAYSIFTTHRLEEYYGKDAREFRPERWTELKKLGWAYVPFNGGPRICLGQQFALTEASYITVRLLQMFPNLISKDTGSYPPKKNVHLTMSLFDGTQVEMY